MPSVATSNPTLTMAALALRSAERIERDLATRDDPVSVARPPHTPLPSRGAQT